MRGQFLTWMATSAFAVIFAVTFTVTAQAQSGSSDSEGSSASSSSSSSSSSAAVPAAASSGTSTASLPDAVKDVKKKRLSAELYTETAFKNMDLVNGDNAPKSDNYFALKYALTPEHSISVRQGFGYTFPKEGARGKATAGDLYFLITDSKLATFGADASLMGQLRAYAPTGESSRNVTEHNGIFQGRLIASAPVKKWTFAYGLYGTYFNQSKDTYIHPASGEITANSDYLLQQFVDAGYNFTETFSISQSIIYESLWKRPLPTDSNPRAETFGLQTAFSWSPIPEFSTQALVVNEINTYDPQRDLGLFRGDEVTYYLILAGNVGIL